MLGSISPVGETSRNQRWWLTATAYTIASVAGGALIGGVLGGAGQLLQGVAQVPLWGRLAALAVIVVVGAVVDASQGRWRLPTWRRQVDERWLTTYRGWVYGAGFGFQLGCGVATIVTAAVTYTALAAALLSASWLGGLAVGAAFGAVRALPLLAAGGLRDPARMYDVTRRVADAQPLANRVAVGGQLVVAAAAAVFASAGLVG